MFTMLQLRCPCSHEWEGLVEMPYGWTKMDPRPVVVEACPGCGVEREQTILHGGLKHRARINDFSTDPRDYRDCVKTFGHKVTYTDDAGVERDATHCRTGEAMHDQPYFKEDATSGRRDHLRHLTDSQRGTRPLTFDMGSK